MAIGDVTASGGIAQATQVDRVSGIGAAAGENLNRAVNRFSSSVFDYLGSQQQVEKIYDNRAMASQGTELDTKFLQFQEENAKLYTDFARDRSASPVGMTSDYDAMLEEREKAFLATVPPRFQEEYKAKLAQDRAQRVGATFRAELELMDGADARSLETNLNTIGSALKGGTMDLETAEESWIESVTKSALPEAQKEILIENGRATIQGLEFGTIVETGAKGYGDATNDYSGRDVVAAGMSPQQRGVLNAISDVEAKSYNVWNGGSTFEGYADHPANLGLKAPGESTAAGRYQFVVGTWNLAKKSYEAKYGVKVPDFSPGWQDRVALHWAEVQFNRRNKEGLNFNAVLASGDPAQIAKIRQVLGNPTDPRNRNSVEWAGLGNAAGDTDERFINAVMGERGVSGGGTGAPQMPNVWTDPRFTHVSLDDKLKYSNAAQASAEQWKINQGEMLKNEMKAFQDQMYAIGYNGGGLDGMEAYRNSPYWGVEAEKKYREGVNAFNEKETSIGEIETKRASGIPLTERDKKGFANWYGEDAFRGLTAGEDWAYDKLRGAVNTFGMLPDGSKQALQAAMTNPATAQKALEFLASLNAGDPSVLFKSGFTEADLADAQRFASFAKQGSPETAMENYLKMKENVEKLNMNPGKARDDALKTFQESYQTSDLISMISTFGQDWDYTASMVSNPAFEQGLFLDAAEAYQNGYMVTGTAEGAEEYMSTYLNRVYGVSYTNKNDQYGFSVTVQVPMKYPPEKFYPTGDGDFGYIYTAMETFASGNLPPGTIVRPGTAVLMPDDVTEEQVRNGELPTYKMVAQGEYGELIVIPDRFGGDYLVDAAETLNNYSVVRESQMSEVQAVDEMLLAETEKLEAMKGQVLTPEDQALVDEQAALVDVTQARKDNVLDGAKELGMDLSPLELPPEIQVNMDALKAREEEAGKLDARQRRVDEGVAQVAALAKRPETWQLIMKREASLTDQIMQKEKLPKAEAQLKATTRLLEKTLNISPVVAEDVAREVNRLRSLKPNRTYTGAEWEAMSRRERREAGLPESEIGWLLFGPRETWFEGVE